MGRRPRVLFVVARLPSPVRGGADLRSLQLYRGTEPLCETHMLGLLSAMHVEGRPETWPSSPDAVTAPRDVALAQLLWAREPDGHPSDQLVTEESRRALRGAIDRVRPDVGIVTLGTRRALEELRPKVRLVVYDAHNVEGPLYESIVNSAARRAGRPSGFLRLLARRTTEIEGRLARSVDQIWACSEDDASAMRAAYPGCAPVAVVPNTVPVANRLPRRAARAPGMLDVVYPASFGYQPNVQAAAWLRDELMPLLWRVEPSARLWLVGAGPPAQLRELETATPVDERIRVTGAVASVQDHLSRASAVAVPLADGGGTRLKVLEAFAAGVPVVSTAKGVEGLAVEHGVHFLQADTAEEFAGALLALRRDETLTLARCRVAHRLTLDRYSTEAGTAAIASALAGAASRA